MTYGELLSHLQDMDSTALDMDVTLYDPSEDEYIPIQDFDHTVGTDVIDDGHPVLVL